MDRYVGKERAAELVSALGQTFAVVENPGYVYPPYDLYPLPDPVDSLSDGIVGAVMDMDGTTTSTEPLCLHSLEMMVRRVTGREDDAKWIGLDKKRDYPHIIGNSTTKHVEYLVRTYGPEIQDEAMRFFYIYAAAWTLGKGADEGRKREVANNCTALGIGALLSDSRFQELLGAESLDTADARGAVQTLAAEYGPKMKLKGLGDQVRAAIDIYYQRYHFILARIAAGEGDAVATEVFGSPDAHLINPMKGIGVFLAMIKGWLGEDVAVFFDDLAQYVVEVGGQATQEELEPSRSLLPKIGAYFERHPIAVAIVTSSIRYEADIVLNEVFRVLSQEIAEWPISSEKKAFIQKQFVHYSNYYDGFVTATDSSEIRLKPHRDLYSMALHQMGIHPEHFHQVVGFEDSESGTVAIRAAGIPLCCALPFPETQDHVFQAATYVSLGGIPEVMLKKRAFLPDALLLD